MTTRTRTTTQPKNYQAIAASRIRDPDATRPPRILVYARNKKGKTRFCLTAPKCLVVDPERGTDPYMKYARRTGSKVWPIESWEEADDIYKFLRTGRHDYEWVSLDGLTRISKMSLRWTMTQAMERDLDRRPEQIGKQDYGRSGELIAQMLHNFSNLPMGVIYTCQERMVEANASDEDDESGDGGFMFVPDLPKGARNAVNSIVDVIARLYIVRTEVKVKRGNQIVQVEKNQHRLWLDPHESYDTGYRSEYVLPRYIKNPTVPRLVQLIKEGTPANGDQ